MQSPHHRKIRREAQYIRETLDKLDAAVTEEVRNLRCSNRFAYRVNSLQIDIRQPMGEWIGYDLPTRNISREGVGLLIGQFVYPNTACRVHLVTIHDHHTVVEGRVVRCNYIEGSANVYEIGVRFNTPIDVGLFHRNAVRTSVLVGDVDPDNCQLIAAMLKATDAEARFAHDGNTVLAIATTSNLDLVLLDAHQPEMNALNIAREMRRGGFVRPIVAMLDGESDDKQERQRECLKVGFNFCILKPIERKVLFAAVEAAHDHPMVSSLAGDAAMHNMIDNFVSGLQAKVSELENAFADENRETLVRVTSALHKTAGAYGFDGIVGAASKLQETVQQNAAFEEIRKQLNALVKLCISARRVKATELNG